MTDQINAIIGRDLKVDSVRLNTHFSRELLLPYPLVEDLAPAEYARLLEHLPVVSPLQLYTTNTREYPFGSAASQTLGYVGINEDVTADDFPGEKLRTFKMRGSIGRDGLELKFDSMLQGEAGGSIFRVDPLGYRIRDVKPIESRLPTQGQNLVTSLDIDLQLAAEAAIGAAEIGGVEGRVMDRAVGAVDGPLDPDDRALVALVVKVGDALVADDA
jgi:penicillin-binding protein 2